MAGAWGGVHAPVSTLDSFTELIAAAPNAARRHNGVLLPNEIPIAFLSVEFERKAAHVALSICRAELASDN